jgi:hypothetical protein
MSSTGVQAGSLGKQGGHRFFPSSTEQNGARAGPRPKDARGGEMGNEFPRRERGKRKEERGERGTKGSERWETETMPYYS